MCKFYLHVTNGSITPLKHHLAHTRRGVVAFYVSVPDAIKKEIEEPFNSTEDIKNKRNELLKEIGEGPPSNTQSSN